MGLRPARHTAAPPAPGQSVSNGDDRGVVLTGIWEHWFEEAGEERALPPGSYAFQPGGEMPGDACVGPEDGIFLLQQSVAADFIPNQQQPRPGASGGARTGGLAGLHRLHGVPAEDVGGPVERIEVGLQRREGMLDHGFRGPPRSFVDAAQGPRLA